MAQVEFEIWKCQSAVDRDHRTGPVELDVRMYFRRQGDRWVPVNWMPFC